ncbi:MAG: hypothetical protein IPJ65_33405 [Archangiaceae bacterium]|nr:hypothetical protein [Archangiaceae bacterium]
MRTLGLWLALAQSHPSTLDQATRAYEDLEFERCVSLLSSPPADTAPQQLAAVELYRGLCHFNLAQPEQARADFLAARTHDPTLKLPAGTSPKAVELFASAAPLAQPAAPAPAPAVVVPTPEPAPVVSSSRARSWWPGPAAVLALGLAGTGTAIGFGFAARQNETQANGARFTSDAERYGAAARRDALGSNIAWACAGAALAAAIIWGVVALVSD